MLGSGGYYYLHRQVDDASLQKNWHINQLTKANGIVKQLDYTQLRIKSLNDIYSTKNQAKLTKQLRRLQAKHQYSFQSPLVVSNPYLTNTTSLYVAFKTPQAVRVTYTIQATGYDKYTKSVYNPKGTYTKRHTFQLIGAVGGVKNRITITTTTEDGQTSKKTFTYVAPKLQSTASNTYRVKNGKSNQSLSDGLFAVIGNQTSGTYNQATAVRSTLLMDNNGVIRGELPLLGYNSMRLVTTQDHQLIYAISRTQMVQVNRLGQVTKVINVGTQGYEFHHDFVLSKDGDYVWALATSKQREQSAGKYVEDQIIKIKLASGKVVKTINMQTLLPALYKTATGFEKHTYNAGKHDLVHLNSIQVMKNDQLLVSSRETSSIIKISQASTNPQLSYLISDQSFWKGVGNYSELLLKKLGNFVSQTGQHSVLIQHSQKLKAGQYYLIMFNNNSHLMDSRPNFNWSKFFKKDANGNRVTNKYSMYYRYLVDEKKRTYRLVAAKRVPASSYVSNVQQYGHHLIVAAGAKKQVLEYDQDGKLIRSWTYKGKSKLTYRIIKSSFKNIYFKS